MYTIDRMTYVSNSNHRSVEQRGTQVSQCPSICSEERLTKLVSLVITLDDRLKRKEEQGVSLNFERQQPKQTRRFLKAPMRVATVALSTYFPGFLEINWQDNISVLSHGCNALNISHILFLGAL